MTTGRRPARALLAAGAFVVVVTTVTTAVLLVVARARYDDAVRGLARAPVGCDTTLEFRSTGTFTFFVETAGTLEALTGGCDAPSSYRRSTERPPRVHMELVDPTGAAVPLERTAGVSYDTGGFVGTSFRRARVTSPGAHVVRVSSDDDGFVVAVGRPPGDAAYPAEQGAIAAAILGGLLGIVLITWGVVGGRPRTPDPDDPVEAPRPVGPRWDRTPLGPPAMPPPGSGPVGPAGLPPPGPLPPPPWQPPSAPPNR